VSGATVGKLSLAPSLEADLSGAAGADPAAEVPLAGGIGGLFVGLGQAKFWPDAGGGAALSAVA
jgi:hypothetical protein